MASEGDSVPTWLSCRYLMAYIACLGFAFVYAMRFNFSIAIVCIVDVNSTNENSTGFPTTFDWDRELQGHLLSSFFYGYLLTQLPAGFLADKYGGKIVFLVGMLASAVATIFVHLGSEGHYGLVVVMRFITGLGTGVVFPCMHSLWAKWAPLFERTKLIAFTYSGTLIGTVAAYFISGIICDSIGWPWIFYLTGGLCLLWAVFWWFGVYNNPEDHPFVKQREVRYIQRYLDKETDEGMKVPWRDILTSLPVWAICSAHVAHSWIGYTMFVCAPMYMSDVLHFNIKSNGLYSAIPYVFSFVAINLVSYISDTLRSKGVRTVIVRKIAQSSSSLISVATLIAIGFLDSSHSTVALVLITLCAVAGGFSRSGYVVNHVDIAPRFAGVLYGLSNTFATVTGILSPIVVGQLTPNKSAAEWQVVFLVCVGVSLAGTLFYVVFGAGEEQKWARQKGEIELQLDRNGTDT